jgi:hypothetical protein
MVVWATELWDTAGQEDYDRLRPLSYPRTDVFIIMFDTTNRKSLLQIESKWITEIKNYTNPAIRTLQDGNYSPPYLYIYIPGHGMRCAVFISKSVAFHPMNAMNVVCCHLQ